MDQIIDRLHSVGDIDTLITDHAHALSSKLQELRLKLFPLATQKPLRSFSAGEVAQWLGIKSSYLRNLALEHKGPDATVGPGGRRTYTAEQIQELRVYLDQHTRRKRRYVPQRQNNNHLQVIAVANFKGGSGKTTTAAHTAQHLAMSGYRVLAIDLDPQASFSALHGYQPEFDIGPNETLYGTLRYDSESRPISSLIRATNFPSLHIIPANIELMEFEYETPRILAEKDGNTGTIFFSRLSDAIATVADNYDVVILDCPPQLGYLTMAALCTATAVLITIHPQMLDVMSMCQFLLMMGDIMAHLKAAGGNMRYDWLRYLVTRYEPSDGPQTQMVAFLRSLFGNHVLTHTMLKSVAISDAGLTKQTLYEIDRRQFTSSTYDRAIEALHDVNGEIERLIHTTWRRGDVA